MPGERSLHCPYVLVPSWFADTVENAAVLLARLGLWRAGGERAKGETERTRGVGATLPLTPYRPTELSSVWDVLCWCIGYTDFLFSPGV